MKQLLNFFIFILLFLSNSYASKNFLVSHHQQSITTKTDVENQYKNYKEVYDKTWQWYIEEIEKNWKVVEYSSREFFVDYQKNFTNKITIDFRNGVVYLKTISENEKLAAEEIVSMFQRLMQLDVNRVFLEDVFENKLAINLDKIKLKVENNFLLVGDLFSKSKQLELEKFFLSTQFVQTKYNDKTLYEIRLELPKEYKIKRETYFKKLFSPYAKEYNLPNELLYSLFLNLSHFNPIAKDTEPSFGIFNIPLDKASLYSYYQVVGRYELLDVEFLYNFQNNIQLASIYLTKLYNEDFYQIKEKKSRIFVSSFTYKYGRETLYEIFNAIDDNQLVDKVNQYKSSLLYKYIYKRLKNKEMESFLYRIQWEIENYEK